MAKLDNEVLPAFDFLINNFYEIVEYKRGRGIYGDRVVLKRPRKASCVFSTPDREYDFFYFDAHNIKELPKTKEEKLKLILKFFIQPQDFNTIYDYAVGVDINMIDWARETLRLIVDSKTFDFNILNNILMSRYQELNSDFLDKLNKHRLQQYFIASNSSMDLVSKDYAEKCSSAFK